MNTIKTDRKSSKVIAELKNLSKLTRRGIRQAFYFSGKDLHETSRKAIKDKNKTGRVYRVRIRGILRNHRASAPGQSPANMTGNLIKSLGFHVIGSDRLEFGSNLKNHSYGFANYAPFLENGTPNMSKRPYIINSIKANEKNIKDHFAREIRKEIQKR